MSEFVKKNMVGYKPLPGGHSDSECTHVILTLQEYDQLLREKSMAEQEARAARDQAAREVAAADRRASQEAYRAAASSLTSCILAVDHWPGWIQARLA